MMLTVRQKTFLSFLGLFVLFSLLTLFVLHYKTEHHAALLTTFLFLFGLLAWGLVFYFTKPVKQILNEIRQYQEGKEDTLPEIHLQSGVKDEFTVLADTLNSLSKKIKNQIQSLTRERNNKSAILESLGEGVVAVDQMMTVTYINHMAEVFLDVKKEEMTGRSFMLAKQPLVHRMIHEAQARKEPALAVLKVEKKPKRYLDAIAVPRGNEGAILVLQDKTGLHKVIELGRDFIANASHELKTPITIIRGFAETLHDHPELSHEVYKEITQKIVSNCQRMETLVRNLLTLAAIDEGLPSSRLQECDLYDLVDQAKQTILTVHPHAEIIIESAPEMYLLADGDLLLQAILNLLDNAVKYSKPPARVKVLLEKSSSEVIIKVIDQGLGIPQEDLDRIFERFYAVDKSHSRSLGGSGLGLSIVERIVEKHRGSIHVESELGKGSTFILTFPQSNEEY
jgi:two-component system phosphate regulon sensor histidine kinase PhoR